MGGTFRGKFRLMIMDLSSVLLISFIGIFYINPVNGAAPQIIQRIVTDTKPLKGIAYLNCTVAMMGNKDATVRWLRMAHGSRDARWLTNGLKVVVPNSNGRYDVRSHRGRSHRVIPEMPGGQLQIETYQLIIKNLLETDDGQYMCQIDQAGIDPANRPQAIGRIVVQSPANIQAGSLLVPKVIEEYKTLVLECNAQGSPPPVISWTRANGKPLNLPPSEGRTERPHRFYGSRLTIHNMTREDRGIYRCHATNNVDKSDEYDVVVEVEFAPKAAQARLDGFYAQTPDGIYTANLECVVNGYPAPDVKFYFGDYDPPEKNPPELLDKFNVEIEKMYSYGSAGLPYDATLYELKLLNVKSNDYGNYSCVATNKFGSSKAMLQLAYESICQGPLCFISQTINPGNSSPIVNANLSCLLLTLICTLFTQWL